MRIDVVSVIEAGYAIELSDAEWVAQICQRTATTFGLSNVFAYLYDASGPSLQVRAPVSLTETQAFCDLVEQAEGNSAMMPAWLVAALYEPAPRTVLASEVDALDSDASGPIWESFRVVSGLGLYDAVGIRAGGIDRRGVLIGFPLIGDETLSRRSRVLLDRVGAHLAAAYRLRLLARDPETASAILSHSGRLLHVQDSEAGLRQSSLRDAIARMHQAKRRGVSNAEESVTAWQALVDGRWSVVDHVDSDGKRLILARRNEPLDRDQLAISDADRQVLALASLGYSNKVIGYELGLSAGAVTVRLKRGLKRIGLNSRQELIALGAAAWDQIPQRLDNPETE